MNGPTHITGSSNLCSIRQAVVRQLLVEEVEQVLEPVKAEWKVLVRGPGLLDLWQMAADITTLRPELHAATTAITTQGAEPDMECRLTHQQAIRAIGRRSSRINRAREERG